MKAQFRLHDAWKVPATLSVTMTLEEWQILRDQLLETQNPSWRLRQVIESLLQQGMQTFCAEEPITLHDADC